jgi:hypothetical protein
VVEEPDVGKMKTIVQEKIGLMRGHTFGWKAFWDLNQEWSCLKLMID